MKSTEPALDPTIKAYYERWKDPERREIILEVARALESEPSVVGCSAHLIVVARKSSTRVDFPKPHSTNRSEVRNQAKLKERARQR